MESRGSVSASQRNTVFFINVLEKILWFLSNSAIQIFSRTVNGKKYSSIKRNAIGF